MSAPGEGAGEGEAPARYVATELLPVEPLPAPPSPQASSPNSKALVEAAEGVHGGDLNVREEGDRIDTSVMVGSCSDRFSVAPTTRGFVLIRCWKKAMSGSRSDPDSVRSSGSGRAVMSAAARVRRL